MFFREEFLAYLSKVRSQKTVQIYGGATKRFSEFLSAANLQLTNMPPNTLDTFVMFLQDLRYKPRSIQTILSGVREYLKYAERNSNGKISIRLIYNPKTPRIRPSYKGILSSEQIRLAIETAIGSMEMHRAAYVCVLACTGLRANEARTLLVEDLSRSANGVLMARVRSENQDTDENAAKFGKERIVPMLSYGDEILINYLENRRFQTSVWLFPSPRVPTQSVSKRSVFLWLEELSEMCSLKIEPHTFRRSYLTLLHNAGVPEITIQKIAGHSTLAQTSDYIRMDVDALSRSIFDVHL